LKNVFDCDFYSQYFLAPEITIKIENMSNVELLSYLAGCLLLLTLLIFLLSKMDLFWGQIETGDMRFSVTGKNLTNIIVNVPGYHLVGNEIVPDTSGGKEWRSWANDLLGAYWIGIPPFRTMHEFTIEVTKENLEGKTPETWITPIKKRTVKSLRHEFPRPFVFMDVEIQSIASVHCLVMCKFQVVDPVKAVFKLKGDFFRNAEAIVHAAFSAKVNDYSSIVEFSKIDREEGGEFSNHFTGKGPSPKPEDLLLNQALIEQTGLKLIGFSASKMQPVNQAIIDAAIEEEVKILKAKAKKAEADGDAVARGIQGDAEKLYIEKTVGAEVDTIVKALKGIGADENVLTNAVMEILRAKALGNSKTLTTFVDKGGNANINIPVKP
jgi:hypothetical protein